MLYHMYSTRAVQHSLTERDYFDCMSEERRNPVCLSTELSCKGKMEKQACGSFLLF